MPLVGDSAGVEVSLDRKTALPGDTVRATIRVSGGSRNLEIDEGRAELVLENEYEFRRSRHGSSGGQTVTTTDRTVAASVRFLPPGTVAADTPWTYSAELVVPADATPTGKGDITEVRWKVRAALVRPHAPDVDAAAALQVLSPAALYRDWLQKLPNFEDYGDLELSFRETGRDLLVGEPLRGRLHLNPLARCKVTVVRVELVRREEVFRDDGNESETTAASVAIASGDELAPGGPRECAFEVALTPGEPPRLETDASKLRWWLRGVAARRRRSDYWVEQELNVFTAPAKPGRLP